MCLFIELSLRNRLKVVTVFDPPFTIEGQHSYDPYKEKCVTGLVCQRPVQIEETLTYKKTCCHGFIIDFFELILEDLQVDSDIYIVEDGYYGSRNEYGEWNGMVGDVAEGAADIAIAALTINNQRSEAVDFTIPYMEAATGILVKPKIAPLSFFNWEFVEPLEWEFQLAMWMMVIGYMIVNYCLENDLYILSVTQAGYVNNMYYSALESMSYISGVFVQKDIGGANPKRPAARVVAVVFAFAMVIFLTSYTAVLAATFMKNEEKNPLVDSSDPRVVYFAILCRERFVQLLIWLIPIDIPLILFSIRLKYWVQDFFTLFCNVVLLLLSLFY